MNTEDLSFFFTGLGVTAVARGPVTAPGPGVDQGREEGQDQDLEVDQEEGLTPLLVVTFKLLTTRQVLKMI